LKQTAEIRTVREERRGNVPLFVHPEWEREFPWLVQGITPRAAGDFASFGKQTAGTLHTQWKRLLIETAMTTAVLGRQVHAAEVLTHGPLSPGLLLARDSDGQISNAPGNLVGVTIADCVPVFVIDAKRKVVAALHAGWRGTAAGIVANCVAVMGSDVHVHLGPAICGECYEVGPEVHEALGLARPSHNSPVDLRAILTQQCDTLGIARDKMTSSAWCTRCGDSPFYSHRGGDPERQVAVVGIRP
jgi:YfiH family protein